MAPEYLMFSTNNDTNQCIFQIVASGTFGLNPLEMTRIALIAQRRCGNRLYCSRSLAKFSCSLNFLSIVVEMKTSVMVPKTHGLDTKLDPTG